MSDRPQGPYDARHPILIVEDDADSREALRYALESEGFPVAEAGNGRQALDAMAAGTRPCVVFLDLIMPVMSGPEFIDELRRWPELAATPVVLLSAWPSEAVHTAGVQGFVRKPFDLGDLFATARQYCHAGAEAGTGEEEGAATNEGDAAPQSR